MFTCFLYTGSAGCGFLRRLLGSLSSAITTKADGQLELLVIGNLQ